MDREKVIESLDFCIDHRCGFNCHYAGIGECEMELKKDVLALLKEQEWIPVTERLPEVRHAVLCYSPHHKNIWALSLHEDNEWYYWIQTNKKYNPDFEGDITHWMPLPEHPKEGR